MESIARLIEPFYPSVHDLGRFEPVDAEDVPADYQSLLAHDDHMTVTVEAFHDCRVDVSVLQEQSRGDDYARCSLLVCRETGRTLQFGVMHIALGTLPPAVRVEIESRRTPLGRVLIRHNVLRHVELQQLWRVTPERELRSHLQLNPTDVIYGRTARIIVEGRPTVQLLEIPRA